MIANVALASQGYAEQIAKQSGATTEKKDSKENIYSGVRKSDLTSIFQSNPIETVNPVNEPVGIIPVKEPAAVQENVSIFSDPVAQSQFKAATIAHSADLQNYDASKVAAKFGGIA